MARQNGASTPIFDQLLREMAEGTRPAAPPPTPATPTGAGSSSTAPAAPAATRRRHRAD